MGIDLPIDWWSTLEVGVFVSGCVSLLLLLFWSIQDYQERRTKMFIRYAILEFWDKSTPTMAFLYQHTHPSTVSDVREKFEMAGEAKPEYIPLHKRRKAK